MEGLAPLVVFQTDKSIFLGLEKVLWDPQAWCKRTEVKHSAGKSAIPLPTAWKRRPQMSETRKEN